MFTSFDKAIAALLGAVFSMLALFGLPLPEFFQDPAIVTAISGAISGLLTYLVPNKA